MDFLNNINIQDLLIQIPAILLALSVHEASHAYVAFRLGDPTAQNLGRITLNPLKHLDPIGTLALIFVHIGWGKPVPVNPYFFRRPMQDMALVSLAGPGSNVVLAVFCALLYRIYMFLPGDSFELLENFLTYSVLINIVLALFNLFPIPPLDGSKILMAILPPQWAERYEQAGMYGFIIVLILLVSGALDKIFFPLVHLFAGMLLFF